MHAAIESKRPQIEHLCRDLGVRRLDVFGSATGASFDEVSSDIDVIVEFDAGPGFDYFGAYFGLKERWRRYSVGRFRQGKSFADYRSDELLQSAVERQFEVVGEALNQLSKVDPELAAEIPELPRIVAAFGD